MGASQTGSDAFEISGTMAPVTVLRLKTVDVERIEEALRAHTSPPCR